MGKNGIPILGAALNFVNDQIVGAQQRQHDKDMAALNNQYMVDQWERENSYNLPSKVAQRYRSAGINPRSVFGQGSASGSGVAGGLSSAPGSSSSLGGYGSFSGLSSNILAAARLQAQNKKDEAEARLAEEKAESENFERNFIKPHTVRLQSALADKGISEATIKKIESQWAFYMADLESRLKEANINNTLQGIEESKQRVSESQTVTSLKEAERDLVAQQINESAERVKNYAIERDYQRALTSLTKNQTMVAQMEYALKQAQKGHTEALAKQVVKEIDYIGKQMQLSDAQIKKWKEETKHMWSEFGVRTAERTSNEIREWVYGWIPLRGNHRPIGFGKN